MVPDHRRGDPTKLQLPSPRWVAAYFLFSPPKSEHEYRRASMAFSVSCLLSLLAFAAVLWWGGSKEYLAIVALLVFTLFAAASLVSMARLKRINSFGLYCFAIGCFVSSAFVLLYLAHIWTAGRPDNWFMWVFAVGSVAFGTPFFMRYMKHGRTFLNNADG